MATAKFYLRSKGSNSTIWMRFNISATEKLQVSTGLKIHSDNWSKNGLPLNNKDASNEEITDILKNLEAFIFNEYRRDYTQGIKATNQWLKTKINTFFKRPDENKEEVPDDNLFSVYLN
ncbi:hypothetical protein, partial [Kaistella sp.]|uniref:hypothetical protein n=1 Tax=Kaistella sp. TaxID=2782235 RepID=UPI003FA54D2C